MPSAARCHDLGLALRRAVESWPQDARVAVIASGGLTHFVINEELDRQVLDCIAAKDTAVLRAIPRASLRSGNSEILNWVVAAGALGGLTPAVVDYIPGYRTPAGTGTGMGFARWSQRLLAAATAGGHGRADRTAGPPAPGQPAPWALAHGGQ